MLGYLIITLAPNASKDAVWNLIEKRVGISRSRRYQIQAVLKLPPEIQQLAEELALSESKLRYVIPLKDPALMRILITEMVEQTLSNAKIRQRSKELLAEAAKEKEANDQENDSTQQVTTIPTVPKPERLLSVVRHVERITTEVKESENLVAEISQKDPRTVKKYREEVVPHLRDAIADLQWVVEQLHFLEDTSTPS